MKNGKEEKKNGNLPAQDKVSGGKEFLKDMKTTIFVFIKWLFFSIVTGSVVGIISSYFAQALTFVTGFRIANGQITYFLPLAGIVIVFLYKITKFTDDKGTNQVFAMVHAKGEIPLRMAPLIVVSTLLTHLFGGSAGREGAALQLGGSLGHQLGKWYRMDEDDIRIVVMSGMSASFAALFGTPLAAAVFAMEVESVGIMHYAALFPCIVSSLLASRIAIWTGVHPEGFQILQIPKLDALSSVEMLGLSALCGLMSILFCIALKTVGGLYRKYFENEYIRIIVSACLILLLTFLLGTRDYMGAGMPVIEEAMEGDAVFWAPFLKILFTALTLGAGFKGGEIVPTFFIGATFGCAYGNLIGLSPSLCAAAGLAAVFCGATNCPLASLFICFELFGFEAAPYFMIAIAGSYVMSDYFGLYKEQKIMYSKQKTKFIDRHTKH